MRIVADILNRISNDTLQNGVQDYDDDTDINTVKQRVESELIDFSTPIRDQFLVFICL